MEKTAIGAIIINKEKELLFTEKKGKLILPGGKVDFLQKEQRVETDKECLGRELREELTEAEIADMELYNEISGTTPFSNTTIKTRNYFITLKDYTRIKASREIAKILWASKFHGLSLSDITKQIVEALQQDKYLLKE